MAVVREDVVKLGFEFDARQMNRANEAVDELIENTQELGGRNGTGKAEDGFEDAAKAAKKFGNTNLDKLSDGIDKIVSGVGKFALSVGKTAMKGIAVGAAAGTAAIVALGTQAVKSYAEYEQLVGGVETLFGTGTQSVEDYTASIGKSVDDIKAFQRANGLVADGIIGPKTSAAIAEQYKKMAEGSTSAAETVLKNANNAYKTAGMSANDYMSNVTSFSASLINALGGDTNAAALLADEAIIMMADNANKMGTDLDSVVGTFQSLARGNYGMLDNLKLGYGGTKSEMERLLKDAEKLTGQKYDITNFADIIKAIKAVQDEMGITGTTAKEASETISGSALAMKAAWANFLTGLADDNADFDQLFDNLMDSVNTFLKNIIPRIKKMLPRLVRGLTEMAKTIGKELPGIMNDLLPALIEGGVDLVSSLFGALRESGPMFKELGLNIIKSLYEGITGKEMSTETFDKLKEKADKICEAVKNIVSAFIDFGKQLWKAVGPALGWVLDLAINAFSWLGKNINWILPVLGSLLGAMLAFKAVRKVSGIVSGFMGLFGKGGGAAGAAGAAGGSSAGGLLGGGGLFSMKPTQVLKGLANIAIIVVGLGALAALIMWVAPKLAKLTDTNSLVKLAAVIGAVGLIGAALAGLSGLVGKIPVVAVAKGLAGIAIALGGFTLIISAFAALSKIKGFNEFIATGGATLTQICGIIGEMTGSIIGGFGEGLTNSLPAIGQNLADFATNIQPMLDAFSGVDTSGIGVFAEGLGKLLLALTADSVFSFFTGGIDYAGLATDLNTFASGLGGFFSAVSEIDESAYSKASGLFECLAGLESLPKEGGVVGWFQGEVDFQKIATGMQQLGSSGMLIALKAIQNIPEEAFASMGKLFDSLAGIKSLPKEGGVVGWFQGEVDFSKMATGIQQLGSSGMILALKAIQNIPEEGFTGIGKLFEALAGIKTLPKEGGVVGWFQGEVDFQKMAIGIQQLSNSAMVIALKAIQNIPAAAFTNLTALFNAMAGINGLPKDGGVVGWFQGEVDFSKIATGLQTLTTADTVAAMNKVKGIPKGALTGLTNLFNALAGINSLPKEGGVVGFFTGEVDFDKLAAGLQAFGSTNTVNALNAIKDVPADAFTSLTTLFSSLAEVKSLPKEGGVVGFFTGEVDFDKLASGLQSFGSKKTVNALDAIKDIPDDSFTKLTTLFSSLADIKSLPKEGGVVGFFTGEVDFDKLTAGLQAFGSDETIAALNKIKDLPAEAFTSLTSLFDALAGVKSLPTEGGFFDMFTGDATTGLKNVISALSEIGGDLAAFYTQTVDVADFTKLGSLFTELAKVNDIAYIDPYTTGLGAITNWMVDVATNCGSFFSLISGLNAAGLTAFVTFLTDAAAIESGTGFGVVCEGIKSIGNEGAGFFAEINSLNTANMSSFVEMLTALCEMPTTLSTLGETLTNALVGLADAVSTNFTSVQETAKSTSTVIAEQMTKAVTSVTAAINSIKAAFNQTITGPKLKLPHVRVSGAFSMNPPTAPSFSVSWYKDGGILTQPTVFGAAGNKLLAGGEAGAEAVVPLETLWNKLETMIYGAVSLNHGYSPESDAPAIFNSGGDSEIINVSPVFNLTISGSADDRATARKIKRYVAEAITETFESMERTGHLSLV